MGYDWPGRIAFAFVGALVLAAVLLLAALIGDGVQGYRAEPQAIACRVRGMDHARRTFAVRVTCVPRAGHGVDTVIVRAP